MKRKSAGLLAFVIFSLSPALDRVANAATVTCGQVITQDTILDADVGPCSGNGIIIGASNITLDLGGHRVFGDPSTPTRPELNHPGADPSNFNGILITRPYRNVTIRNGSVIGFADGVTVFHSSRNLLERLVTEGNRCSGIRLQGLWPISPHAENNVVRENVVRGNGCAGIVLRRHTRANTIERNVVVANAGSGVGILPFGFNNDARDNRIRQNSIRNNGDDGVSIFGAAMFNAVTGNVIRANGNNGVSLRVDALSNQVEGNRVLGNVRNGVVAERGSFGNSIVGNVALGNAAVAGSYDLAEENQTAFCANRWMGNTFQTRNGPCIS